MRILVSIFLALQVLAAGCAATHAPSAEEFLLTAEKPAPLQEAETSIRAVYIKPVRVADYLKGDRMVIVKEGGQISRTSRHLWAEPLAAQLRRTARIHLAARLPEIHWSESEMPAEQPRADLMIRVDSFQATWSGHAEISGCWQMLSPEGRLLEEKRFHRRCPLRHSGYQAMVKALNQCWNEIIDCLARNI